MLPTKKGLWVSLNDKPMIADNRDLEKMFAGRDDVHFLDLEDTHGHSKIGNREKFRQGQQQSEFCLPYLSRISSYSQLLAPF